MKIKSRSGLPIFMIPNWRPTEQTSRYRICESRETTADLIPLFVCFSDRNGQHRQQASRNHHHRRYTSSPKTVDGGDDVVRPSDEMSSTTRTTGPLSPFLMVTDDSSKTMIPVQASLNGNIFMHCPVDINEDFQVSQPIYLHHLRHHITV